MNQNKRNCYIKRLDCLSSYELELWHELQDSELVSPFVSYEFCKAVYDAKRLVHVAFVEQESRITTIFPFEYRSGLDRMLSIASRVGGYMSDCMTTLSNDTTELSTNLLLTSFSGINLDHAPVAKWGEESESRRVAWLMHLASTVEAYWDERNELHRQRMANLANRRRKIIREKGELVLVQTNNPTQRQVEWVIGEKRKQYVKSGARDIFIDEFPNKLINNIMDLANSRLCLVVSELYSGDNLIASHLGLRHGSLLHFWFPVYDEVFRSYSPGLLLLEAIINTMPENGVKYIDFGEGDSEYKRMFSTQSYCNLKTLITATSVRGAMAKYAEAIRWRLNLLATG